MLPASVTDGAVKQQNIPPNKHRDQNH